MKNKQKQIMKPYSQLNTTLIDEIGEKINFFKKISQSLINPQPRS
jgi:hypothetical protein